MSKRVIGTRTVDEVGPDGDSTLYGRVFGSSCGLSALQGVSVGLQVQFRQEKATRSVKVGAKTNSFNSTSEA